MTAPIYLAPDMTKLVVVYLRDQPEVTALLPAAQIRGRVGDAPTFPLVRVTRITDTSVRETPPLLDQVQMQLDVWGGNNRQAERIAATCRAALVWRLPGYENDEGVVTHVVARGTSDQPDDAFSPPRQRYIVLVDIWARPIWQ